MELKLKGRVAIITGGSKGIGRSIAQSLAEEQVSLVICGRDEQALIKAKNELLKTGAKIEYIPADITNPEDARQVSEFTLKKFRGLDILINNAGGIDHFGRFDDVSDEDWQQSFELNVMGMVYFIRECLPLLRTSKAARIINVSSIAGAEPGMYNPHYTAMKAAGLNLTKSLANQLAVENVLVNSVSAGPVHSYLWDKNIEYLAQKQDIPADQLRKQFDEEEAKKVPLGRIGKGEDVAGIVTFLASDLAGWITGSCFHVDGGKLRSMS